MEAVILGDGGRARQEVVRMLIEAGADLDIGDSGGTTALGHALRKQQGAVARLLREAGAHA
ncbi:ankyrin repeat domain-containing protein [Paeniglutamicibacter sp. NPDC012692]|uniref:ankyrin repeat domain-containing protein n=1 Tax=Paeniglutamicibacter sp. NPDC012692 TaxID=3364388 RepID=UPI0036A70E5C